jgi:tetratricopeptide (TPR) repeat protein
MLDGGSADDPDVAREKALLAVYEGDCDKAVALLAKAPAATREALGGLDEVARGCQRVTAGTIVVTDEARGLELRLKDERDRALVPFLAEVAELAVAALDRDLGVRLPRPVRIEVVPDHYSLAAMTGLPEEAAQTTGTVAVAKWGRVTMLSPRAAPHGYPWADTLMHELVHLSVTRATRDRAPLWLQEGTAKREETRWRSPWPWDDVPSPDSIARAGFDKGIALPLDKLGPSIAMLPTAEQAMVAFSEVHGFLRYFLAESGDAALPKLLDSIAIDPTDDPASGALSRNTNASLSQWSERWQKHLADVAPAEGALSGGKKQDAAAMRELMKKARLGELLGERGHPTEALPYLERSAELARQDPSARARLAQALRATGRGAEAERALGTLADIRGPHGVYLALRGAVLREKGDPAAAEAFRWGRWLSPFDVEVACEAQDKRLADPNGAALCEAAHAWRGRLPLRWHFASSCDLRRDVDRPFSGGLPFSASRAIHRAGRLLSSPRMSDSTTSILRAPEAPPPVRRTSAALPNQPRRPG